MLVLSDVTLLTSDLVGHSSDLAHWCVGPSRKAERRQVDLNPWSVLIQGEFPCSVGVVRSAISIQFIQTWAPFPGGSHHQSELGKENVMTSGVGDCQTSGVGDCHWYFLTTRNVRGQELLLYCTIDNRSRRGLLCLDLSLKHCALAAAERCHWSNCGILHTCHIDTTVVRILIFLRPVEENPFVKSFSLQSLSLGIWKWAYYC